MRAATPILEADDVASFGFDLTVFRVHRIRRSGNQIEDDGTRMQFIDGGDAELDVPEIARRRSE